MRINFWTLFVEDNDILENTAGDDSDSSDEDHDSDNGFNTDDEDDDASVKSWQELDMERVEIHGRILHDHTHFPPFEDITHTIRGVCGVCDCDDFCLALCLQESSCVLQRFSTCSRFGCGEDFSCSECRLRASEA
jgi:hypothetical protein